MRFRFLAAAAVAAFSWAIPANAVPIAAVGTTDVTVDATFFALLTTNSISATPIEGATASGATFSFDIEGGNTSTLVIEHSGGVLFDDGTNTLSATNFLINGIAGTVSANVNGGSAFVALFDLAFVDLSGPITAVLKVNGTLSGAIVNTFFGSGTPEDLLAGGTFGSASTSPTPVPLPASALLLVAGIAGLAAVRRRRSAA